MPTTAVTAPEEIDWTRVDRKIITAHGKKSARQLSEETGLTPEQLLQRKQELVDSVDELTILMQKHALMGDLQEIADEARKAASSSMDEFKAGLYNARIAAIKLMLTQLEKLERTSNVAVESLNALRVRELMRLMDRVVFTGVHQIAEAHGLDEQELLSTFQETLQIEAQKMDDSA